MSERKGKIHEGGTVAPDGTHYPTVLIEVEAADVAADPAVSRLLVALFNLMQGKEFAGQERADGGRQGDKRRVGAARRRSRGHGPARLDGTRPRATVASKVMDSGKMAGQATARS